MIAIYEQDINRRAPECASHGVEGLRAVGIAANEIGSLPRKEQPPENGCLPRAVASAVGTTRKIGAHQLRVLASGARQHEEVTAARRPDFHDGSGLETLNCF